MKRKLRLTRMCEIENRHQSSSVTKVSAMDAIIQVEEECTNGIDVVLSESENDDEGVTPLFVVEEVKTAEERENVPVSERVDLLVGHPEAISVGEQMQILCDLYGFKQDTYWDCYRSDQRDALKNKLSLIVSNEFVTEKNLTKMVSGLTSTIWKQAKYTDDVLYMSPIFIATVPLRPEYVRNRRLCVKSMEYNLHPVFRIMKCIDPENFSTKDCCMIFVDEHERVYQNWNHYKRTNQLPSSFVVTPKRGIFNTNSKGKVDLEIFYSPASSLWSRYVKRLDRCINIVGLAACIITVLCLLGLAIVPHWPVLGYIILAAAVLGVISAIYSVIRSSAQIRDMSRHGKSISLLNPEARGCWLGIAGGVSGIVAGAATRGLTQLVAQGHNVSNFLRVSVNAFNAACVTVSGLGLVNGFAGIILKYNEEKISSLEIIQLSASLFLFTHSLYNFQTASSIIKQKQSMTINEFRQRLSKNQRRQFDKMSQQTVRMRGPDAGQSDVIRTLKAIPDKNNVFHTKIKADEIPFNSGEVSTFARGQGISPTELESTLKQIALTLQMRQYVIIDQLDLKNIMVDSMENLTPNAFQRFLQLTQIFVKLFGHNIEVMQNRVIPFEEFLAEVLKCISTLSMAADMEISDFIVSIDSTEDQQFLFENIKKYYNQFNKRKANHKCTKCPGHYVSGMRRKEFIWW